MSSENDAKSARTLMLEALTSRDILADIQDDTGNVIPKTRGGSFGGSRHGFETLEGAVGEPTPIAVDRGMLGFFAAGGDDKAFPLKVVGPKDVELSPDDIIAAPDGGWGWMIVFIGFLSNMIVDGIIFSFNLVQNAIIELYDKNSPDDPDIPGVAWIGSLILGFNFLSGPLTSAAADRFGFRAVSMIGAIVVGFAFVIAAASSHQDTGLPRLWLMYIFYGVIGGLGTGMIYMPSVVCVGYYFDKKRALAVGLAISGSGCGAFVFSLVTKALIDSIGWRGTVMIHGIMLFGCSMIGALYRPLEADYHGDDCFKDLTKISKQMRVAMADLYKRDAAAKLRKRVDTTKDSGTSLLGSSRVSLSKRHFLNVDDILNPQSSRERIGMAGSARNLFKMSPDSKKLKLYSESSIAGVMSEHEAGRSALSISYNMESAEEGDGDRTAGDPGIGGFEIAFEDDEKEMTVVQLPSKSAINRATARPEAFAGGSTATHRDDVKYVYTVPTNSMKRKESDGASDLRKRFSAAADHLKGVDGDRQTGIPTVAEKRPNLVKRIVRKLRSIRVTSMPAFWIIAFAGFLMTLGYPIPYIYLGELAKANNVEPEIAAYLLPFLGMANTLGRILCGYFSDSPKVNSLYVNNVAGMVGGTATFIIPFVAQHGLPVFIPYTIIFGGSMACFATLRSILIRDFIGLSVLASAFGLCLSVQGVAAIVSSPMAVGMRELTDTYTLAFVTSGSLMIAASLISFLLPIAHRRQLMWDAKKEQEEEERLQF